jgi:hypothetical protein
MNQADLIAAVAAHASLTNAGKAVEAVVSTITEALKRGEEVRIAGFGTFGISERGGPQFSDRRADHDRRVQGCQVHRRQGRPQRLSRWARFSRDPRAPPTEGGSRRSSPKAAAVEKQSGRQPQQPGSPPGVPGVVRCALSAGTRKGA